MTVVRWLALSRGWLSILILLPVGFAAAFSAPHFPAGSWGQFACQSLGWLLFLGGAAMRWWATLYIGGRKTVELLTEGPYSVTRNPIYFGTFLLTLAVGMLSQSASFVAATLFISVAYLAFTVTAEEDRLRTRYGAKFDEYCQRVPRFFPQPRLFQSAETVHVQVRGLRSELLRACRWAWIPILCDLLAHFRAEAWWPVWFRLP